jgi:hypothetical protein
MINSPAIPGSAVGDVVPAAPARRASATVQDRSQSGGGEPGKRFDDFVSDTRRQSAADRGKARAPIARPPEFPALEALAAQLLDGEMGVAPHTPEDEDATTGRDISEADSRTEEDDADPDTRIPAPRRAEPHDPHGAIAPVMQTQRPVEPMADGSEQAGTEISDVEAQKPDTTRPERPTERIAAVPETVARPADIDAPQTRTSIETALGQTLLRTTAERAPPEGTKAPQLVALWTQSFEQRPGTMARTLQIGLDPAVSGGVTATLRLVGAQLAVEVSALDDDMRSRLHLESDRIASSLRALGYEVEAVRVIQPGMAPQADGRGVPGQAAGRQDGAAGDGGAGSAGREQHGDDTHGNGRDGRGISGSDANGGPVAAQRGVYI